MTLLDAQSRRLKRILENLATAPKTWSENMNSPMPETDSRESQLASEVRNATGTLERAEVLRDRLTQMLDRLRGPTPKPAPDAAIDKMVESGAMTRLTKQHGRTNEAIEIAIQTLSEIEEYV